MPHRGLSESSGGPEPIELRADGGFSLLDPLDQGGGDSLSDSVMTIGGGGILREADSAADASKTRGGFKMLESKVADYAVSISEYLDQMATANAERKTAFEKKVSEDAFQICQETCRKIASKIVRALGWLNAWMAYAYSHPSYEATKNLREVGLSNTLKIHDRDMAIVDLGIAQMRQFITAVMDIDLTEAVEVPYEEMNPPRNPKQASAIAAYKRPAHLEGRKKA